LNSKALAKHRHVMVSSEDVRSDLELFYGKNENRIHVIRFASFADTEPINRNGTDLRARYGLPPRFFICTNQVWRHKNHAAVLRALAETATDGEAPMVVFTGREHDYRHRDYAASIKALAVELGLTEKARFLGFLPRVDQLGLISTAIALIQPSLCEGWSVAVEDAKALGKHVLASDIPVHREQLDRNADFFAVDNDLSLSELLRRYRDRDPDVRPQDYERNRKDFAESLLRMLEEVSADRGRV
jgi:glycosyltransferase involved in cell wall biosynthesis